MDNLEKVANVKQLTKLLETMTNELSIDEVKDSLDVKLGKEEMIKTIEENIENMLDSLRL